MKYIDCRNSTFFEKFETKVKIISDDIKERSIQEELAEDIISIIHLFSEKLYGLRSAFILIMCRFLSITVFSSLISRLILKSFHQPVVCFKILECTQNLGQIIFGTLKYYSKWDFFRIYTSQRKNIHCLV